MATHDRGLFDKKFVFAACLIGVVYTAVVVAIAHFFGKDAAGVAGAALTVLAVAIFRQFENLRFRPVSAVDGRQLSYSKPNVWVLLLFTLMLVGTQTIGGLPAGLLVSHVRVPQSPWIWLLILYHGLLYMGGAFVAAKALPDVRYSTMLLAFVLSAAFLLTVPTLLALLQSRPVLNMFGTAPTTVFWLGYLVSTLAGAWLGKPRSLRAGQPAAWVELELVPTERVQ
jgi:hypothetical protein